MNRLAAAGIFLIMMTTAALGLYELTAKSPVWLGTALPGWQETRRIERTTHWAPVTGILPVDKFLHESEEAARYYGLLAGRDLRYHSGQSR